MLDLDFIRRHTDRVRLAIAQKRVELDLDEVLSLDAELRSARSGLDALRAEKNRLTEGYAASPIESRAERGRLSGALGTEIKAAELKVDAAVKQLPARQREVVKRHFGFGCEAEQIADVAASLHVSQQRARAIERDALYRLRDGLEPVVGSPPPR